MILTTVNIENPSKYVSIVLPVGTEGLPIEATQSGHIKLLLQDTATGHAVEAQVDVVARDSMNEPQAIQLVGFFDGVPAPSWVNILTPDSVPTYVSLSRFRWTKKSRNFLADLWFTHNVSVINGPITKVIRLTQPNKVLWLTFWTGSDDIRVDMVDHNAQIGAREYQEHGSEVGPLSFEDSTTEFDNFIEDRPIDVNSVYFFPQRSRRIFRGTLRHTAPDRVSERAPAHNEGIGIDSGGWKTKDAWTSAALQCADVPATVASKIHSDLFRAKDALKNNKGYPYPSYTQSKDLGLWHPSWSREGGQTGGSGITTALGMEVASIGKFAGIHRAYLEQRMVTDRHHVGILDLKGNPARLEDFVNEDFSMRSDDANFDKGPGGIFRDGPFGFSVQPDLDPADVPEKSEMDLFEPMDWAHLVRFLQPCVVLAWLTNDHLSRWLILQEAENARLSWDNGRLTSDLATVTNNPRQGIHFSRIHGWMLTAMAEAYSLCNGNVRQRVGMTLQRALTAAMTAEMESGLINCDRHGKEFHKAPYNGQHGVSVCIQHGLLTAGLYRACMAIGEPFDFDSEYGVEWLLHGSQTAWSGASAPASFGGPQGGINTYPVRLVDSLSPPYVGAPSYDSEQTRACLGFVGFAAMRAEDYFRTSVVNALIVRMLGPAPTAALVNMQGNVADSDLVLLAYCQAEGLP